MTSFSQMRRLRQVKSTQLLKITQLLGWCKSNCGFTLPNFAFCYRNTFLNKCGYVIHHFNEHLLLFVFFFFANDLLLAAHFRFILDQVNDVRTKSKFERFSYSSSKWVVKQWRQLATSTMHLTQELLMNIQCSGGSRSSAKEATGLKMSTVTGHHS